jgi:hypothetical protein
VSARQQWDMTEMANRGLIASIPIWVRVSGITVLALAAVVASSALLGSTGFGGGMSGMATHQGATGQAVAGSEPASAVQLAPGEGAPAQVAPAAGAAGHVRPSH